jgi:hypothetical protein
VEPGEGEGNLLAQRDLRALSRFLTSNLSYDDWRTVLMAMYWAYGGSPDGFELADQWSADGEDYPGRAALLKKWQSFAGYSGSPVTLGSVCKIAREHGIDLGRIPGTNWEEFQPAKTEIIEAPPMVAPITTPAAEPFSKSTGVTVLSQFSLTGHSEDLAKEVQGETFFLDQIAVRGQATVFYAPPNAGKTLITLNRLTSAICNALIDPKHVYYINADDTSQGLLLKLKIAERWEFNMLAPSHMGFDIKQLLSMIRQVCLDGTAKDVILIVDTLKKVTDLMDKQRASKFTEVIREFVAHGGTFLGLAHVNKKPGPSGKSVFAGTTDIRDDFDCAYVIDVCDNGKESGTRVVEFTNEKRRGSVADIVRFSYRTGAGVSYMDVFESVVMVDNLHGGGGGMPTDDSEAISIVEHSIRTGHCRKAELLKAMMKYAGLSRRASETILHRYTGSEGTLSKWNYEVREHGAHMYFLHADRIASAADQSLPSDPLDTP